MMSMPLSEAAAAINAKLNGPDIVFRGLSTDTRTIERDSLFVALHGPNFDAHEFLDQAQESGAAAVTISREAKTKVPQLVVSDTLAALGQLAAYWRQKNTLPLVAVTGSNGKTTVKEMMAAILKCKGPVLATRGNLNNDIGVPLTLTRLGPEHRFAVIEMGANHPGEIDYLAGIAQPDVAVITNVGAAHLAGFGSLEGVAAAKGELFQALNTTGTAIINAEDRFAPVWRDMAAHCGVMDFALDRPAAVTGEWQAGGAGSDLLIRTPQGAIGIELPLAGRHNALNALAATAATLSMGVDLAAVKKGLESLQPVPGRLQQRQIADNILLLDDTYNANPDSLGVALDVLKALPGEHWLVLGDMGELGPQSEELHRQAGEQARSKGVHRVFSLGELAGQAAESFGAGGSSYLDRDSLVTDLQQDLHRDLAILVKGSRAMVMENVVNALLVVESAEQGGKGGRSS